MQVARVHDKIYRIMAPFGEGGTVFLYLLKGDSVALVDTGVAKAPQQYLTSALAQLGMSLSDVDLILNTHAHLDHAGGNLAVKAASTGSIHLHSGDQFMAESTDAQVEFMNKPLRALGFSESILRQRKEYIIECAGQAAGVDRLLSDGDVLELGAGIKLSVLHCPGHTPGSACYYWESEGVLFTGDAIQGLGSRPGSYPLYFDAPNYRNSLETLAQLDFRLLCLGHAYLGGSPINEPTRTAEDGRLLLSESKRAADCLHRAVSDAIDRKPSASQGEIAIEALSELAYHIPQLLVRQTRIPIHGGPTLVAHIDAAKMGSYPSV
ncbi:MAG: MBL fold metallo-hydrolase [Chloroflexota bacterium]|jgi:glyoxylase-like metal-dependent hydrolase (beta-lactamase superfamily II)